MVGIVFQDPESQFFNMAVEDEVAFGPESLGVDPKEIAERVDWALGIVDMQQYLRRSPFHLSGGQKQRVAIASILAMQPKILVLDEPTSGLDPMGKAEVFRVVRELKRQEGMTIVMVEQEAEKIAEFSDRVVVLADGAVAMDGTPQERLCPGGADEPDRFGNPPGERIGRLAQPAVGHQSTALSPWTKHTKRSPHNYKYKAQSTPCRAALFAGQQETVDVAESGHCIIVENLWFQYTDEIVALRGIDLEIPRGAFVAVLGRTVRARRPWSSTSMACLRPTRRGAYWSTTRIQPEPPSGNWRALSAMSSRTPTTSCSRPRSAKRSNSVHAIWAFQQKR